MPFPGSGQLVFIGAQDVFVQCHFGLTEIPEKLPDVLHILQYMVVNIIYINSETIFPITAKANCTASSISPWPSPELEHESDDSAFSGKRGSR